ncbi:MAG: hypothetical protein J6X18_05630 [Bacteroidales bacterium]|nr:hypothetical protein [Bacteroidales bacterium]
MKKSPKYSVGCEVAYKSEDGCECQGSVCRITEIGKECFHYTLKCGNGKKCSLYEDKIIDKQELKE